MLRSSTIDDIIPVAKLGPDGSTEWTDPDTGGRSYNGHPSMFRSCQNTFTASGNLEMLPFAVRTLNTDTVYQVPPSRFPLLNNPLQPLLPTNRNILQSHSPGFLPSKEGPTPQNLEPGMKKLEPN